MLKIRLRNFARNEDGAITPLLLVLFTSIVLMTGVAIDLLRHEAARADLQAALDRGVLAAASLSQTLEADDVVADYVENRIWSDIPVALAVDPTAGAGGTGRRIEASASFMLDSMFLKIAGLDQLRVAAASAAQQSHTAIEISLVLDISGTMRYNSGNSFVEGAGPRRIEYLRPAANDFLTDVLDGDGAAFTSVSIIPYAGGVNPGRRMYELLGGETPAPHDESYCLDFTSDDFYTRAAYELDPTVRLEGLPAAGIYEQVPHFHYWGLGELMDWGWCPSEDRGAITYLSNDLETLTGVIDDLNLHDGTGTYNGMRWALALLDPESQPTLSILADEGVIPEAFANRPAAWPVAGSVATTRKIIVLMTDGQITEQRRPTNGSDPRLATDELGGSPFTDADRYLQFSATTGTNYFYGLCDAAKAQGIEIYTIAFNAPAAALTQMEDCASAPKENYFFNVQDAEIATAFETIAAQITRLKLVN